MIFPPCERPFAGGNSFGEATLEALRFYELEQAFAVSAHIALNFDERGKVFALGLRDVECVDGSETV